MDMWIPSPQPSAEARGAEVRPGFGGSAQAPDLLSKELDIPGGFLEEETSSDPKQSHVEGAVQNPYKECLG